MKRRVSRLLSTLLVLCLALALLPMATLATSVKPTDTATKENVLEVLNQYDTGAYHIMKTEENSFMDWFMGGSVISGMDTAVHETYHRYTFNQSNRIYSEKIYLGNGKSYNVDYSVVNNGGFTKTEEMSKNIPAELQTGRYSTYVAPGASPDANTKGVFGLLNEFTAYYWGLETMNSLAQFLIDSNAGNNAWQSYVISIGNNMTAYAEFKYWTLRYMLYIRSANPTLYQAILNNENYCAAYRDADTLFVSEIVRSREIIDNSAEYLSASGYSVDWSDSVPALVSGSGSSNFGLPDTGSSDMASLLEEMEVIAAIIDKINDGDPLDMASLLEMIGDMGEQEFDSWESGSPDSGSWSSGSSFSGTLGSLDPIVTIGVSSGSGTGGDYSILMAELETAEYLEMDSILKKTNATPTIPAAYSDTIPVLVNGKAVTWTDAEPFVENGRTLVPLRAVADAMGLTVEWDNDAREASFSGGGKTIVFPIGSTTARTSGDGIVAMDTAAVIRDGRTYAPIRYLAEYFGYTVGWDNDTRTVSLTK